MPRQRTPAFQVSQILLEAVSKVLLSEIFVRISCLVYIEDECRRNAQLESEGTGEDGRQENGVPANDGPIGSKEHG